MVKKKGTSFAIFVLLIEFCNLTKFGQDWTENENFSSVCKILAGPLLKFRRL